MTAPAAPALYAFVALSANVHAPRLIRAMFPAGKPAKSAASQPGVASPGGAARCVTGAVTSPLPEYDRIMLAIGPVGGGATCSSTAGDTSMNVWNWKSCTVTAYPAARKAPATYSAEAS